MQSLGLSPLAMSLILHGAQRYCMPTGGVGRDGRSLRLIAFARLMERGSGITTQGASQPQLSIVVPAYNEGWRLPDTLGELFSFLTTQSYKAEVMVVENGSSDDTAQVVQRLIPRFPGLRLMRLQEAGKGRAVRAGVLDATGDIIFLCDADLSTPAAEIPRFMKTIHAGYDIVVGSREGVGAI